MASSPGTPTTSAPFELSKLLKTPTTTAAAAATSSPATPPPSSSGASPPPLSSGSPFSYAPAVPPILHHHHPFLHRPAAAPNPNPSPGARVTQHLHAAAPIESAASQPPPSPSTPSTPPPPPPSPARVLSGKKPRGRRVGGGERAVHDVDWRMQGEAEPPQLEVTPITKYTSDPDLVLGRQIAVNRSYIVYGLKLGNIRVLNINTALRSLLRGHTQRVTDMAFFAEDVQLLASASADGRVFIWKIDEGPDKENKPQITAKIVTAIQIVGDGESYHPRICWHSHKQEILFVGIGSIVLKIDTIKVGRGKGFSAEEPLKCPMEKLIDGVQLVGKHDGDVTDLSISQWMTTRLASASKDGTVKIWDERKAVALSTLRPHDGQAVNSVAFLTSPDRPDHINLVTAGPLSREVKIWASTSDEGWLLPSDSESWRCNQLLELRSTSESRLEEAFFNQVVILPRTSLLILANAKKNAIYAVHIDYSPCPASTCMDYMADFTVTMPILSLTATSDCPLDGEQVVQLYCVQTMAIQQYALDLSLCLPPPFDNAGIKRNPSNSRISNKPNSEGVAEPSLESSSSKPSPIDYANEKTITSTLSADASATEITTSPVPLPFNPSGRLPSLRSSSQGSEQGQSLGDHDTILTSASDASSVNNKSGRDETSAGQNRTDASFVPAAHVMFKVGGDTTHLVTPSEILSGAISSSEDNHVNQGLKCEEAKIQGVVADNNNERAGVEVKVVERSRSNEILELDGRKVPEVLQEEDNEKLPKSLESNSQMASTGPLLTDAHSVEESCFAEGSAIGESLERSSVTGWEADKSSSKDIMPEKFEESAVATALDSPLFDIEEQKAKKSQVPSTLSPSSSPYNSTDLLNEPGKREIVFSSDVALPQILAVQDALNQLVKMQKDMQTKLSDMVAVPVAKEGKRMEAALGRSMEKIVKANFDALWARFQEENAKREKIEKDRMQHIANVITNCINKDLPSVLERALKKEISALGPVVARALTPVIEKTISSAVADSFQRGVVDKAVNQLDKSLNSKLDASLTRQIQTQFQMSGRQALQDALKSSLESSVIPTFEQACKAMLEQIDAAFQKGMSERATAAQLEAAHTPLAIALRDAINSASSITQSFTAELVDGQHKLLALVAAGNTKAVNPIAVQTNNGHIAARPETAEAPPDPKRELSRLITEHKYEEAFMSALQRSDVSLVSWLCSQVDLRNICSTVPLRLNQGVLLALLQQLACDLANDTSCKVAWMTDVAVAIHPADPMISLHVRSIFEQVYNMLGHQRSLPTTTPAESSNIRLLMHVVNSVLLSCK